ncbi:MAG: tetratricopeptide repeat protein [Phycisphaerae bacterium]|nr:tetratricopeptide repeat protein [Phycisphaerae bacterium]
MVEAVTNNTDDLSKAITFFTRAQEVAATDNFDYAIDMFIEGLQRAPDAVEQGHKPLRHNALIRQAKGGKKPSMIEKMRHSRGKNPFENMLNAEYLLAKDPENLIYAEQMLKAAIAGGFKKTALWIADLIFEANKALDKPSLQTYLLLKDSYAAMEEYAKAVGACGYACRLKPDDAALADEFKNLSAHLTMQKGKYDQDGDFRQSIQDRDSQEKFQLQKAVMKTVDFRQQAVTEARQVLASDNSPQNIFKLADALGEVQTDEADKEAIKLLDDSFGQFKDFTFKRRSGEVMLRMLRRNVRKTKVYLEKNSSGERAREAFIDATKQLLSAELEHYRLCMENYPTDLRLKYEYGIRLMRNQRYDEAIPYLQEAKKEPKHKISAMNKIGLCFFMKSWFTDAIDILNQAIGEYEIKDNDIAKDLRYNLARAYEQQGNTDEALELYRKLAQLDYSYKDVRARVARLRNEDQ